MSKPAPDPKSLLADLVRIPSVNPQGDPGIDKPGEQDIAEYLAVLLKKMGGKPRLDIIEPGRPNVSAVFPAHGKVRRRILLAPHIDTVSVKGMTIPPFGGISKGGKIWGRGASDTKGPMACMLVALQQFQQLPPSERNGVEITFVGLMGEEAGNIGAKAFARSCPRYDMVIVGEPTDNRVVHAHKGALWLELETRGKAGHASTAHPRDNAIYKMAPAFQLFERGMASFLKKHRNKVLGAPSAHLTVIGGGSKTNISPELCNAQVDIRLVPELKAAAVISHIKKQLGKDIAIRILGSSLPLSNDLKDPLVRKVLTASEGPATAPWFCDAAIFAEKGMPAVALGPGSIAQAHTADEWIRIKDLQAGTAVYLQILKALSSQ